MTLRDLQRRGFVWFLELLLIAVSISLLAYGYPNKTRMALWEEGGAQGFNSDPKLRIYFYANHLDPPEIPFIWSQGCTNFNLGAALLTLWFYLTRLLLVVMGTLGIWTEVYLHSFALIFWVLSCIAQQSSDYSDAKHPSRVPWYLAHACSIADSKNRAACRVAQVSFVMTLVFMCFYAGWIIRVCVNALADYTFRKHTSKGVPLQGQSFRTHSEDGDACESSDDQSPLMRAWDDL